MRTKIFITLLSFSLIASASHAQQYNEELIDSLIKSKAQAQVARNSKFLISGYTNMTARFSKDESSFSNISLVPILLWKPSEKILVEAELETGLEGSETSIELGYADVSFFVNKYLTIRTGKFISPFGIFQDRLHPSWINKLPTFPVGTGEDELGVGPTSEIGVDFRGGVPLGTAKMNYSVFLANGAQLITDPAEPEKQGTLTYGNAEAISKKLTAGGRLGLLPFSNSSLELGVSYRTGNVGDKNSTYKNVGAQMYAFDLTYVHQLEFIKGLFDVKAQYNKVNVDKAAYIDPDDQTGNTPYTFDNKRSSFFTQAAYKPTMLQNKFLKKAELVFRYAEYNPPDGAKDADDIKQYTYGLNYWFTWRTVLKAAYQSQKDNNVFFLQIAVGF
ncbi:hypothetical protein A3860_34305 [Niastella vici]|uniref:Porin n=1 Tax=Niastella vici TaxID=1703345 RepID=A0A1V9FP73_9BACT|nr:hypothetical protein [Niastella vici]OQP60155.1 hypothetical protein A3860_34305 [Niastella vici]